MSVLTPARWPAYSRSRRHAAVRPGFPTRDGGNVCEAIRDLVVLEEHFGVGNWLKLKGFATVCIEDGTMHEAEIHWYEAEGIGMRWAKIKRYIE